MKFMRNYCISTSYMCPTLLNFDVYVMSVSYCTLILFTPYMLCHTYLINQIRPPLRCRVTYLTCIYNVWYEHPTWECIPSTTPISALWYKTPHLIRFWYQNFKNLGEIKRSLMQSCNKLWIHSSRKLYCLTKNLKDRFSIQLLTQGSGGLLPIGHEAWTMNTKT